MSGESSAGHESYRVFVVRLHDEGADGTPVWRGVIEIVGTDERYAVANVAELVERIERSLRESAGKH